MTRDWGLPDRIWLTMAEWVSEDEGPVFWSDEQIEDTDREYIAVDKVAALTAQRDALAVASKALVEASIDGYYLEPEWGRLLRATRAVSEALDAVKEED